jgi:hypothetical protein
MFSKTKIRARIFMFFAKRSDFSNEKSERFAKKKLVSIKQRKGGVFLKKIFRITTRERFVNRLVLGKVAKKINLIYH